MVHDDREKTPAEKALAAIPDVQQPVAHVAHAFGEDFIHYTGKAGEILRKCAESGEPIFVFRAKDIFSVMVIAKYLEIIEQYGPSDHAFQQEIVTQLAAFKAWQHQNTALVRYPD